MEISIQEILQQILIHPQQIKNISISHNNTLPPELAYKVDFPRIEIILDGELEMLLPDERGNHIKRTLMPNDILYVESQSWNKPIWLNPVTTLSILFGKQQLGISLVHWNGKSFERHLQKNTPRRGPRIGAFILNALSESIWKNALPSDTQTLRFLILSLLSHSLDLLNTNVETSSKTSNLFEAIRQYIDIHFSEDLTRDHLANMFYISPNYLSHLFQKEGNIGLNEYINQVRLENAKLLLKNYELNIKKISEKVGFNDSNYFCRIFKKRTKRSPTEYRQQYHSKITEKLS